MMQLNSSPPVEPPPKSAPNSSVVESTAGVESSSTIQTVKDQLAANQERMEQDGEQNEQMVGEEMDFQESNGHADPDQLMEPEPSLTEPEPSLTEPDTGLTEPDTGLTEPETGIIEPETGLTEPETSLTEPETGLPEPETGLTEPESSLIEPDTNLIEPESSLNHPESASVEPERPIQNGHLVTDMEAQENLSENTEQEPVSENPQVPSGPDSTTEGVSETNPETSPETPETIAVPDSPPVQENVQETVQDIVQSDQTKEINEVQIVDENSQTGNLSDELEKLDENLDKAPPEPAAVSKGDSDDIQLLDVVETNKQKKPESSEEPQLTVEMLREKLAKFLEQADPNIIGEAKLADEITKFILKQSQKNPQAIRKILDNKELLIPTSIILPPSQVVDLIAEYEPEKSLGTLLSEVFDGPPPETQQERGHKNSFKMRYPAPHMTRQLYDIGLQLAQESTYTDIVNMKNLPEKPKNPETYKQVVSQVKPVLDMLNRHMASFKIDLKKCGQCNFKTESRHAMTHHLQYPHNKNGKLYCGFCSYHTGYAYPKDEEKMKKHYKTEHGYEALFLAPFQRAPCSICDEEFPFKGVLAAHYRTCKNKSMLSRNQCMKPTPADVPMVNNWLWPQPVDGQNGIPGGVRVTQERYAGNLRHKGDVQASDPFLRNATFIRAPPPQMRYNTVLMNAVSKRPPFNMTAQSSFQFMARPHNIVRPQMVRGGMGANRMQIPPVPSRFNTGALPQTVKCEICDQNCDSRIQLLLHFQTVHGRMCGKTMKDMGGGAPLACSRCRERFWTYEGLERHLLMAHQLVTNDLLAKAQNKADAGRCKVCDKQYAFNLLQHLVVDHKQKLCSAEILYSCDVCTYQCTSYKDLDVHLVEKHNTGQNRPVKRAAGYELAGQPPARKSANVSSGHPRMTAPKLTPNYPSSQPAQKAAPQLTKKVRYTCTPCALKFEQYKDVIQHWQLRHLARITVELTKIDDEQAKQQLAVTYPELNIDWEMPVVDPTPAKNDIICLD